MIFYGIIVIVKTNPSDKKNVVSALPHPNPAMSPIFFLRSSGMSLSRSAAVPPLPAAAFSSILLYFRFFRKPMTQYMIITTTTMLVLHILTQSVFGRFVAVLAKSFIDGMAGGLLY